MDETRQNQLDWINRILKAKGWTVSKLAETAGLNQSTISRFQNSKSGATLSARTINSIEDATGIAIADRHMIGKPPGVADEEATPIALDNLADQSFADTLRKVQFGANASSWYVLQSRALEFMGYQPGDYLLVDHQAIPGNGDPVCAIYNDPRPGASGAIMRIYEAPFLMPSTFDKSLMRPMLIDSHTVSLNGVIVASLRTRLPAAAA